MKKETRKVEPSSFAKPIFEFVRYTEFKRILDQILSAQKALRFKSLAIMSAFPGEGKTFFVSALALGYATLLNRKVLIVDTVNQPNERSLFLNHIFQKDLSNNNDPQIVDLISTGEMAKDSAESADFHVAEQLSRFNADYDLVLYDTCAINKTNKNNLDPIIIAKDVDATLLLQSPPSLSRESIQQMSEEIERWELKVIGTVFNRGAKS